MMARSIYLAAALAALASCGRTAGGDAVARKHAERDSLKAEHDRLGLRLKEVEDWLALNDSTTARNLPLVSAMTLRSGPFIHYIDVHGVVKPDESADLYPVGGRVAAVNVVAGDRVHKGQVLITLDNDLVRRQTAQAQAAVDLARTTFDKQQRLWEQRIGSEIQFLQAKANKEQAEAALATLHEQQRLSNITAPFDGTVDEVMVRPGDMAAPTLPAARVVGPGGALVEAEVSEVHVRRIRPGAPVEVSFPAIGEGFSAPLLYVSDFINPMNRSFTVKVRAPKGQDYVRPNLLGDLRIQDARTDSALVLPAPAVLEDVAGNSYVFILGAPADGGNVKADEAVARKVFVDRVSEYRGMVHVAPRGPGGLKDGDRVVTEGAKNVSDGQAVRVAADGR